jgi:hypothetical protein
MAARKGPVTRPTDASVEGVLASVPNQQRREDARRLSALMQEITGELPAMWGTSIVGFGAYHYRYASGHEGDAPLAGFSPRSQHLVIYLASEFGDRYQPVVARLGPHRTGKGCLYIKRLGDVDRGCAARADRPFCPGTQGHRPRFHLGGTASRRAGARRRSRGRGPQGRAATG